MKVRVSAPGKIILSGEHAVVYGYPAILSAINQRLYLNVQTKKGGLTVSPQKAFELVRFGVKKTFEFLNNKPQDGFKIKVDSQIPIGCGMGSSAAAAVSLVGVLCKLTSQDWNLKRINEIAYEIEKKQHLNPSGGDNTISTYGGFLWYRKESEKLKIFSQIALSKKPPEIFLLNTGKPKETTGEMVAMVAGLDKHNPKKVKKIFINIEEITRSFLKYLTEEKSFDFGELLRENEKLLEALGIVSGSTIRLIREIEKLGGAAKISGAGGKADASGILLAYHQNPSRLKVFAKKHSLEIVKVKLAEKGVRIEKN